MRLSSARELKRSLLQKELAPLLEDPLAVRGFAVAAEQRSRKRVLRPTLALGISRKPKGDYRIAVRIQDRAVEAAGQLERIRTRAKKEVDVRYVGWVDKQAAPWNQRRVRPLQIGTSIAHVRVTAGTLGCFVQDKQSKIYVLSNNHVLANENAASRGDRILQQGPLDGGLLKDRAAVLARFIKLSTTSVNLVDAALAEVLEPIDRNTLKGLGQLQASAGPRVSIGQKVFKLGRTTDLTQGKVTAFELDNLVVRYGIGTARLDDQIEVEGVGTKPFSRGGDSGSLVVDAQTRGVALLFAGSDQGGSNGLGLTYASPLATVLSLLGVILLA